MPVQHVQSAVGLPVALAFSKKYSRVIGFDIKRSRIDELKAGHDRTNETDASSLKASKLVLTCDVADLREATFYVVTVPRPVVTPVVGGGPVLSPALQNVDGQARRGGALGRRDTRKARAEGKAE